MKIRSHSENLQLLPGDTWLCHTGTGQSVILPAATPAKGSCAICSDILDYVDRFFHRSDHVEGKARVLITAGPTQEALDPVRYLTNHSSGKMGYSLAQAALDMGSEGHADQRTGAADSAAQGVRFYPGHDRKGNV